MKELNKPIDFPRGGDLSSIPSHVAAFDSGELSHDHQANDLTKCQDTSLVLSSSRARKSTNTRIPTLKIPTHPCFVSIKRVGCPLARSRDQQPFPEVGTHDTKYVRIH